ncbi:M15 family metallopeptidase [Salinivibrio costicola]|uniref:M15 family metallopeptidase n=1 Tax=Salinivibrio costicola TaxID=51367 RepID=UPI000AB14870|nr:M15 family metallopeptidase [Salinivibrio costicola]
MNAQPGAPCLHQEVLSDVVALQQAASRAGFALRVASGYRAFERQLAIWNGKFNGDLPVLDAHSQPMDITRLSDKERVHAILRWSALPGASRHHWGTDMDVYDKQSLIPDQPLALTPPEYDSGPQAAFSSWLYANVSAFGFFLPYARYQGGLPESHGISAILPPVRQCYPLSLRICSRLRSPMRRFVGKTLSSAN